MDVKKYASEVMDSYDKNREYRSRVAFAHASNLEKDTGYAVGFTAASRIADQSMHAYDRHKDKGATHEQAKEKASDEMAARFNSKGRDLNEPIRQQQSRSASMTL